MPYSFRPPGLSRASKAVTAWPRVASLWAQARPAGPAPTTATLCAGGGALAVELAAGGEQRIGGVALQAADLDRLALGDLADADLLAQGLGRADPGAHAAHDVGIEDGLGGAERVAGGDLADEQRDVDRGRAGLDAGRVVAEQAALGGDARLARAQARVEVGEVALRRRRPAGGPRRCPELGSRADLQPLLGTASALRQSIKARLAWSSGSSAIGPPRNLSDQSRIALTWPATLSAVVWQGCNVLSQRRAEAGFPPARTWSYEEKFTLRRRGSGDRRARDGTY